jgi:ankyrin repeat protein
MSEDEDRILGLQLVTAAATGALEMVKLTLEAGTDIHFDDDLALRSAAFTGNLETLRYLTEKGANVQAGGNEALFYAAKRRETETVEYLLSKGARVDDMMKHHKGELDEECLATLDKYRSNRLSEAFEKNFSRLKKADDRFRLPPGKKPPSP